MKSGVHPAGRCNLGRGLAGEWILRSRPDWTVQDVGENQKAREILEPLARNAAWGQLVRRHRMLGRAYEGLGLWLEAAGKYEVALENPHLKWHDSPPPTYPVSAVLVLEQFRLAQIYDRLGDIDRARHWYERFTQDWKDADPDIPELIEARERLAELKGDKMADATEPSSETAAR